MEFVRNDGRPFLYNDDLVDRNLGEVFHLRGGLRDLKRLDGLSLAEATMDVRVICRHVAHAAFGLLYLCEAFLNQLQDASHAVTV